jgi:hypothetical protein
MPKHDTPQTEPEKPSRDEVIEYLIRDIHTLVGLHLKCRESICRRMRRCAGPDMRCDRDFPAPQCSDEEWARIKADFYKALQARAAELDREEAEGDEAEPETVSVRGRASGPRISARSRASDPHISARSRASCPCKASPDRAPSSRRGARS